MTLVFYVYWLRDGDRTKIGLTDNLQRRIREVDREFGCSVELVRSEQLATRSEAHRLESALHWHHRALALGREWFRDPPLDADIKLAMREFRQSRVVEVRLPLELLARLGSGPLSLERAIAIGVSRSGDPHQPPTTRPPARDSGSTDVPQAASSDPKLEAQTPGSRPRATDPLAREEPRGPQHLSPRVPASAL